MSDLVCLGVIIGTHGVSGRVKIKTYTENPKDLTAYGQIVDADGGPIDVKITGEQPNNLLAEIEGVKNKEKADLLKGTELFVPRSQMPETEGEYYYHDLVGLQLKLENGGEFGSIKAVNDYGAGPVIDIALKNGKETSFTYNTETFPEVNVKEGFAVINPPEIIEVLTHE